MTSLTDEELAFLHEVFEAARAGRVDLVVPLLDQGLTPNLTNAKGDTLLILAAYHKQRDMVRALLEHGADHARVNDMGQTALGCAVFRQEPQIVADLLAAGRTRTPGDGAPAASPSSSGWRRWPRCCLPPAAPPHPRGRGSRGRPRELTVRAGSRAAARSRCGRPAHRPAPAAHRSPPAGGGGRWGSRG